MGILERLASTLAGGPDVADDVREEIEAALARGGEGNWAAAEIALVELSERHRDVAAVFVALGEVRARRNKEEAAVAAFGRAVDLQPQAVDGWLGLGETLVRLGRYEPAREALRKVLSRTHDPLRRARAHAGRGRVALALDEPPRAVRELRQAAELAPGDYPIAHDLGRALSAARDGEAWTWLVRAAHAPDADAGWVLAAAEAAPTPGAAEGLLRESLEARRALTPAARAALEAALAEELCQAGRPEAGLPLAESAAASAPDSFVGPRALALCHERAGRYREALAAALQAVALQAPRDPALLVRLALGAQQRESLAGLAADAAAGPVVDATAAGAPVSAGIQEAEVVDDPGATPERQATATSTGPRPDGGLQVALRAFAEGRARDEDLVTLGSLAPDEASRRFVAATASPGEAPAGNLFALLTYARELAGRTPELAPLLPLAARAVEAFDRPLLIAVMGEFNTGKSSFVNALCGEKVARVGVTPTTATINVLRYGPRGARILYHDGRARELTADEASNFLARLDDARAAEVRVVEVFLPVEFLRQVEVVDTPGLNSLRPEHEVVARGFLTEADAIVWLFAVGQAAKATERDALALAQSAGKRVLGVLNKADQTSADELRDIRTHVESALGDRIEVLLPFSAREALRGHAEPDPTGADGGLGQVRAALEERFFSHARALKRTTALGALTRFAKEARALVPTAPGETSADGEGDRAGHVSGTRLDQQEVAVAGALAAERLRLRAQLDAGFRQAAAEVAELFEPRFWPFGDRRTGAADREFLFDLLEDAIFEATVVTARELEAIAAGGPPLPIREMIERFRAYARGTLQGGAIDAFLREHLAASGPRSELPQLQRALTSAIPDLERELLDPLVAATTAAYAATRAALAAERAREEMRRLVVEERLHRPLASLEAALTALHTSPTPQDGP
jgi:tetratricopeptide (TPR) repeat protein/GTP-binding protein EngB required for normal cell division